MDEPQMEPQGETADETTLFVRRAIRGDEASMDWVVRRLSPLLLNHARYRMGPILAGVCDPADLVQEAWLIALDRLPALTPREGRWTPVLLRFLSTTILHRVQNLLREHARRDFREGEAGRLSLISAGQESGIIGAAMRQEEVGLVLQALEALPTMDRKVVILRGVEQQAHADIGTLLGLSADAAAKRYQRALRTLRARLPRSVFDELSDT